MIVMNAVGAVVEEEMIADVRAEDAAVMIVAVMIVVVKEVNALHVLIVLHATQLPPMVDQAHSS